MPDHKAYFDTLKHSGPIHKDRDVATLVNQIQKTEGTLEDPAKVERAELEDRMASRKPHHKDSIATLYRAPPGQGAARSVGSESFVWSEEYVEQVKTRDRTNCLKKDGFREYVEALAKSGRIKAES
jgi:hypothetical protein